MPGNVNHLDTINFNDTISMYTNQISQFEAIVRDVNSTASTMIDRWKGKGRNAFEKDYKQVQLNLKDVTEIMYNLLDALVNALDEYIETDSALSSNFQSSGTSSGGSGVSGAVAGAVNASSGGVSAASGALNYYNYKGTNYIVANNFNEKYLYNQTNYEMDADGDSFLYGSKNSACTVTAELMAWSMLHNEKKTPDQVTNGWGWIPRDMNGDGQISAGEGFYGSHWKYSHTDFGPKPSGEKAQAVEEAQALEYSYNNLKNNGIPTLIRVSNDSHSVLVVGFNPKPNDDVSNLQSSDFIIADPQDGAVKSLSVYTVDNPANGNFIRVPI